MGLRDAIIDPIEYVGVKCVVFGGPPSGDRFGDNLYDPSSELKQPGWQGDGSSAAEPRQSHTSVRDKVGRP